MGLLDDVLGQLAAGPTRANRQILAARRMGVQ